MSSRRQHHLLVVGAGSVGKRHLRNLADLGCSVSAVDPRPDRLKEAAQSAQLQGQFPTMEEALAADRVDGVIICSPTRFHVPQAILALHSGLPVFLEKPLSVEAASGAELARIVHETEQPLLLGYTYRWWPPIREFAKRLHAGQVGKPLHVKFVMSAHLADWHPWERYQDFFMASRELGGGALLDESHFVDLMVWLFGMPEEAFARVEKLSALEIDSDDNVDAWFVYPRGMRVHIHLDLFGRPHERSIVVTGEKGTLQWSVEPNRIRFGSKAAQEWTDTTFTNERNEMFVLAAQEFLDVLAGKRDPSCTVDDGLTVLRILESMRASSASGHVMRI